MRRAARGGGAFFVALLLAGCAAPGAPTTSDVNKFDLTPRWSIYEVTGRIAVRKGEDAFSGSFHWSHAPISDRIELSSPLGQTVALMQRDKSGIQVQTSDGATLRASDWESLTTRVLGWALPVNGLMYWIEAAASPDTHFETQPDASGRPAQLRQQGWTVRYREYDEQSRPTRMQLEYGDLDLRIAVDTWETSASAR